MRDSLHTWLEVLVEVLFTKLGHEEREQITEIRLYMFSCGHRKFEYLLNIHMDMSGKHLDV